MFINSIGVSSHGSWILDLVHSITLVPSITGSVASLFSCNYRYQFLCLMLLLHWFIKTCCIDELTLFIILLKLSSLFLVAISICKLAPLWIILFFLEIGLSNGWLGQNTSIWDCIIFQHRLLLSVVPCRSCSSMPWLFQFREAAYLVPSLCSLS